MRFSAYLLYESRKGQRLEGLPVIGSTIYMREDSEPFTIVSNCLGEGINLALDIH